MTMPQEHCQLRLQDLNTQADQAGDAALTKMRDDATGNTSNQYIGVTKVWNDSLAGLANRVGRIIETNVCANYITGENVTSDDNAMVSKQENLWHADNKGTAVSPYVSNAYVAFSQDKQLMQKAISSLDTQIAYEVGSAQSLPVGKVDVIREDRIRQLAENGAMLKLGAAENEFALGNTTEADALIDKDRFSVKSLIQLAEHAGANRDNTWQLKKMAEYATENVRQNRLKMGAVDEQNV